METELLDGVRFALDSFLFEDAVFLLERWSAETVTEETKQWLATAFMRQHEWGRAYHVLKGSTSSHNRYLHAKCCYELDKLQEAEATLVYDPSAGTSCAPSSVEEVLMQDEDLESRIPNGAAGMYLLAKICDKGLRTTKAIQYYSAALKSCPYLWTAYERLCDLGVNLDALPIFSRLNGSITSDTSVTAMDTDTTDVSSILRGIPSHSFFTPAASKHQPVIDSSSPMPAAEETPVPAMRMGSRIDRSSSLQLMQTPQQPQLLEQTPELPSYSTPVSPRSKRRTDQLTDVAQPRAAPKKAHTRFAQTDSIPQQKRSSRLSPVDGMAIEEEDDEEAIPSDSTLGSLLSILAEGYRFLSQFKCAEAVAAFQRLPPNQYNTSWVLTQVGKAYFEMVNYAKAEEAFKQAHRMDPYRMDGLEVYSTVLWHLKKDIDLSALAQETVECNRLAPQSWCAVGNCFSLQKEHETALKFFQRAIQVDPSFTYAYTLCGHEYVANEDLDKAVSCYRNALRTDSRHYNAWWGLGNIYYRQEKFELAEYHFRRALALHGRNSVLCCYLGMVMYAGGKREEALLVLRKAAEMEPNNPLATFQTANVLMGLNRHQEALEQLQKVRECAPKESSVHFLMGKIFKKLGKADRAMLHFTTALDLDPKDVNLIKAAIDKIYSKSDVDEEDEI
eukprot:GILK01009256.1.p1 GENE.GILK01009256.1~~GILK01009256.1.p1  ORF type:complete len:672 (-),score=137.52 GILK01009256.1:61-2076(-)